MALIDTARVHAELAKIRDAKDAAAKGKLLESLIAYVFCRVPGLSLDDQDIVNRYGTEEIDLVFWNDPAPGGVHFLDCPLIVECKGWSTPVTGREVRYFATLLQDKGHRNGVLVALNGVTGSEDNLTASFFHTTIAVTHGVRVLVITGVELESLIDSADLVKLLKRRMLELTKFQIQEFRSG